jgi:cytochrome c-type biogenesis protein CcmH
VSKLARLLFLVTLLVTPAYAFAFSADEPLADPKLELRAREISGTLRCLVCQNQSIEDSNADLAKDIRRIVRERLAAGDSDAQVRQYLVDRYGDWVLLKPPFRPGTYLLWLGPPAVLLLAAFGIAQYYRRRQHTVPVEAPLTADEQQRLTALLDDRRGS